MSFSDVDEDNAEQQVPLYVLITTYLSYLILMLFGHLRDFFGKLFKRQDYIHLKVYDGYAPLISDFESFYSRRMYHRIRDNWNRPITGVPGRTLQLLERTSSNYNKTFQFTGNVREVLNLSSYNYLGFAQNQGPCADSVEACIKKYGVSVCGPRAEAATLDMHREVESLVARFVGKEDAILISMGFATNSTTLPCLMEKGSLIISDELNHSCLVFGSRLSNATIRVFRHNNVKELEKLLIAAITEGQPRTHRPWTKIMVLVEGLYSMEGSILCLREIVALKKKYKFYLFVDEAHSIGALGPRGRGVADLLGVDPADIDIMMGTFTKSFGAAGGYLAASRDIIQHLRNNCHSAVYAEALTPPIIQQILTSMKIIMGAEGGDDGKKRLDAIRENAVYFRRRLKELGFMVYGDSGSPVIPLLLFHPGKIGAFSRECLKRNIAVVVVGYPATPIVSSRARFCISSAHTRQDLDDALEKISEVGDILQLKICKQSKQRVNASGKKRIEVKQKNN